MPKWERKDTQKISITIFKRLFYKEKKTVKQIADFFGVHISSISSFRQRWNLPIRGWGNGHPLLGKHHSISSINKIIKNRKNKNCGENNPNWKGGMYICNGYRLIKVCNKYIGEHRYIMEQSIKRKLNHKEHIHHIDGNKINNDINNLIIISNCEHGKIHYPKGSKFGINAKV